MRAVCVAFLVLVAACTPVVEPGAPLRLDDHEIRTDTTWSGRVVIDGTVKVARGAVLNVTPGTQVAFVRRDRDGDGLGDGTLVVEGELVAVGTRAEPIVFRSAAADPRPGDWLEIRADFSRNVQLRYCLLRDSAYTLHAHFTRGVMEDCTVAGNIDGCRLGEATFAIRNCLVEENSGKGINFRNSRVEISRNIIRRNGSGIFLFETDRPFTVGGNNIHDNLENFRLGDFFAGDVALDGNWWGAAEPEAVAATIYDRGRDPALGRVALKPAAAWLPGTGPRDSLADLFPAWKYETAGFVDAAPLAWGDQLVVASWDGTVVSLDGGGRPVWRRRLGEVVDAGMAADDGALFVQTWGRQVYALDRRDGSVRWRFGYPGSPADDHRQGGLVRSGELLLVPAWNGTLYALDAATGMLRWKRHLGLPLRAAPGLAGGRIYVASGAGLLGALNQEGKLLWQRRLQAALLSKPLADGSGPVVLDREGRLTAFDREGEIRWRQELGDPCFYAAPVRAGKALLAITAGGRLFKVDAADGDIIWSRADFGPAYATPLVADGRVFVGDNDGQLTVLGLESGDRLATLHVGREIQGGPVRWEGRVVFGARDHQVHVFDLEPGRDGAKR